MLICMGATSDATSYETAVPLAAALVRASSREIAGGLPRGAGTQGLKLRPGRPEYRRSPGMRTVAAPISGGYVSCLALATPVSALGDCLNEGARHLRVDPAMALQCLEASRPRGTADPFDASAFVDPAPLGTNTASSQVGALHPAVRSHNLRDGSGSRQAS